MATLSTIVGVYDTHHAAIEALKALKASGLPLENTSFISKADVVEGEIYASSEEGYVNAPIEIGVILGPILGILAGTGLVLIPGLGFIYGAGAIAGAIAGFDIGLIGGAIPTLLMTLGINKDKASTYKEFLESGKYIITISGDEELAEKAKLVLHTVGLHIDLQHHK
jgi:hypothetical protein